MQNHVKARVMWIPLVLVGSMLYWTLALGLGGMSLSLLGGSSQEDLALRPKLVVTGAEIPQPVSDEDRASAITVHLQSLNDLRAAGGSPAQDDGTGRLPGADEPAPPPEDSVGRTSY
jgi:hypothetical protein